MKVGFSEDHKLVVNELTKLALNLNNKSVKKEELSAKFGWDEDRLNESLKEIHVHILCIVYEKIDGSLVNKRFVQFVPEDDNILIKDLDWQ